MANISKREFECLFYVSEGMTYKKIGRTLGISHRTVESHIASIKKKLQLFPFHRIKPTPSSCGKQIVIDAGGDKEIYIEEPLG